MKPRINSAKISNNKPLTKNKFNITSSMFKEYVHKQNKPKDPYLIKSFEESSRIKQNQLELNFNEQLNKFFKIISKEKLELIDPSFLLITDINLEYLKFSSEDMLKNSLTEKDYLNRLNKVLAKDIKNTKINSSKNYSNTLTEEKGNKKKNIDNDLEKKEKALIIQMYYRRYLLSKKSKELKKRVALQKENKIQNEEKLYRSSEKIDFTLVTQNEQNLLKELDDDYNHKRENDIINDKKSEKYSFEINDKSLHSKISEEKELTKNNIEEDKLSDKYSLGFEHNSGDSNKYENKHISDNKLKGQYEEKMSFDSSKIDSYHESFDKNKEIEDKVITNSSRSFSIEDEF